MKADILLQLFSQLYFTKDIILDEGEDGNVSLIFNILKSSKNAYQAVELIDQVLHFTSSAYHREQSTLSKYCEEKLGGLLVPEVLSMPLVHLLKGSDGAIKPVSILTQQDIVMTLRQVICEMISRHMYKMHKVGIVEYSQEMNKKRDGYFGVYYLGNGKPFSEPLRKLRRQNLILKDVRTE